MTCLTRDAEALHRHRAIDRHAINDVASLLATVLVDRHLLVVVAEVIGHRGDADAQGRRVGAAAVSQHIGDHRHRAVVVVRRVKLYAPFAARLKLPHRNGVYLTQHKWTCLTRDAEALHRHRAIDRHAINDVASLLATVLVDRHLLVVVAEVIGHRGDADAQGRRVGAAAVSQHIGDHRHRAVVVVRRVSCTPRSPPG